MLAYVNSGQKFGNAIGQVSARLPGNIKKNSSFRWPNGVNSENGTRVISSFFRITPKTGECSQAIGLRKYFDALIQGLAKADHLPFKKVL